MLVGLRMMNAKPTATKSLNLKNAVGIKLPPQRREEAKGNQGF
jgi:hypothetical protein